MIKAKKMNAVILAVRDRAWVEKGRKRMSVLFCLRGKYQRKGQGIMRNVASIAVIILLCFGCSAEKRHDDMLKMYDTDPPIADANPNDRHEAIVQVKHMEKRIDILEEKLNKQSPPKE